MIFQDRQIPAGTLLILIPPSIILRYGVSSTGTSGPDSFPPLFEGSRQTPLLTSGTNTGSRLHVWILLPHRGFHMKNPSLTLPTHIGPEANREPGGVYTTTTPASIIPAGVRTSSLNREDLMSRLARRLGLVSGRGVRRAFLFLVGCLGGLAHRHCGLGGKVT